MYIRIFFIDIFRGGNMAALSSVSDAWARLQDEFENAPEVGYVWTINIDSDASVSALGLAKVDYHLKLSCSHVGETMHGAWGGEMSFSAKGSFGGLQGVLALAGLGSNIDSNVWFKNDKFLMRLNPYSAEDEADFVEEYIQPLCTAPEGASEEEIQANMAGNAFVNAVQNVAISGKNVSKNLINSVAPDGFNMGYYTNHTEGDLGQSMKLFGFVTPLVKINGQAQTDKDGQSVSASMHANVNPIIMPPRTINEKFDEDIAAPFPHTISVFSDGSVLFRVYNSSGGPITVNFLGKMDKVPVGETTKI